MNIYLGHLSNYIQSPRPSTLVCSILDDARRAGKQTPPSLPERTLAMRLPEETVEWLRQQAEAQDCARAEIVMAYADNKHSIADQIVSELTALYQRDTISSAGFSAALWSVLGFGPEASPGEEVREST